MTPHEVAMRDQFRASLRTYAEMCFDVLDAFIAAGFQRDEATELMVLWLQMRYDYATDE